MKASKLQAAVEAILFASGEPVELEKIAQVLEIDVDTCEQIILNLSAKLDENTYKMHRNLCGRIRRILISSCKTLKENNK